VYILDDITKSILVFEINTGEFVKYVHNVGQGPSEYIKPIALSSYGENVYLLDFPTHSVIRYDKQLNPLETFRLPFASPDFIAFVDGFYFYNVSSAHIKEIVKTNKKGKVLNDYMLAPQNTKTGGFAGFTGKHFSLANNGNVYFTESSTNKIVCINNKKDVTSYTIDFGKNNIPANFDMNNMRQIDKTHYAVIADFFSLREYNVISFIRESKRYFSILEMQKGKQLTGIVRDEKYDIPFFPRWKLNDSILVGTCNYLDLCENFDGIRKFLITDIDNENIDPDMSFLLFFNINLHKQK
jgi:hypothetical protein